MVECQTCGLSYGVIVWASPRNANHKAQHVGFSGVQKPSRISFTLKPFGDTNSAVASTHTLPSSVSSVAAT